MGLSMEISCNPDPSKQAQKVIFNRITKKEYHAPLTFNNNNVSETNLQKHLGVVLNNYLSFEDHLKMILSKINKTICLLLKLQNVLPRSVLLTIYKSFIRLHLGYVDTIYDQAYNASSHQKLELLQCNGCLAITATIGDTSREKLCKELGLESLQLHRCFRKLSCFYKLFNSKHPHYLFKLIPSRKYSYVTGSIHIIPVSKTRNTFFNNFFFPSTIIE